MKKIFTILSVSLAFVVFANTANAQTATSAKENQTSVTNNKGATATDLKSQQQTKEVSKETQVSSNKATKTAVSAEDNKQNVNKQIEEYQTKIDANRNNPNFDLKSAEAELARLKSEAGIK